MRRPLAVMLSLAAAACSDGPSASPPPPCSVAAQTGCGAGQYCEVQGTSSACFAPVLVRGTVVDPAGPGTIGGARIVALDATRAAVSSVSVTSEVSGYELAVHAPRDATGKPISPTLITLRADAQNYQTFPSGVRPALPVDLSTAALEGGRWVVHGPLTRIELLRLAGSSWAAVHGAVAPAPSGRAALVVAEPLGGGAGTSAVAGLDGSYAIFNLAPDAAYAVTAYAQGVNYAGAVTPLLEPGTNTTLAPLAIAGPATATVTGGLIYNRSATQGSDVTLVLESTYLATLDRGESPPGLTVHTVGNADYTFSGVPNGRYVVLAAFNADANVRDLSSGGMTAAPRVTVAGASAAPGDFKIVPAIELRTIGGVPVHDPYVIVSTATPTFTWGKGTVASAASYRVAVFDEFGMYRLPPTDVDAVTNNVFSCTACGLEPGHFYQLRILGLAQSLTQLQANPDVIEQLTQTEDVLGVFTYQPVP